MLWEDWFIQDTGSSQMLWNWFLGNKLGYLGRVSVGSLLLGWGPLTPASVGIFFLAPPACLQLELMSFVFLKVQYLTH